MGEQEVSTVGKRIQSLRKAKSLSLRELAKIAGCSPGYLSMVENNQKKPSRRMIESFARALSTSSHFLLSGEQSEVLLMYKLIEIIEKTGNPDVINLFKDLMFRLYVLEVGRHTACLMEKEKILDAYAEQLKKGQVPAEVEAELRTLNKTVVEIENRLKGWSCIIGK